jgi:hypothetical protein
MRVAVWWLLPLTFGGCSGGYPLEPTRCDELCHVTKGPGCARDYDPVSCVITCEQTNLDADACRAQLDSVVTCFRDVPGAVDQQCDYFLPDEMRSCRRERELLILCARALNLPDGYVP